MKLWIARDQNGALNLHSVKPYKVYDITTAHWFGDYDSSFSIPKAWFPELTFEDSPMEVRLMREDVVNANYQSIADYEDFLGLVSLMRKAQKEANDMIAQVECYQEAQDYIKKAEELEAMVDKFIEERT